MVKLLEVDGPSAASATCAVAAGWFAAAGDAAMQVLGVPLTVVMAAAAGAFLARSYQEPAPLWRAFAGSSAWVVVGCAGAPFMASFVPALTQKFLGLAVQVPSGAVAFVAACICGLGPFALPLAKSWVHRKFGGDDAKA